jgi:ABC-type nitrate/sulfonate/bicarbonate transport system substrate-binding protein
MTTPFVIERTALVENGSRSMRMKHSRRGFLGTAMAFAAATSLKPAAAADEIVDVRVVVPSFNLSTLPTLIASDLGLDREAGMRFIFTQAAGSIGLKAMLAGEFEFSLSPGAATSAAVTGAPVRVIVVHIAKSFYYLISQKSYTSVAQLAGKSVGVGAIGDSTDVAARAALLAAGVDTSNVNFVAMGIDNVPAALIAGALDAGVVTPPRDIMLGHSGKLSNLKFLGDYLPPPNSGVATTAKMISQRPELVQKFVDTAMRGHRILVSDKAKGAAGIEKYMQMSKEDSALAWDRYIEQFTPAGTISPELQAVVLRDQIEQLKPRAKPTAASVFDMQFVEKAKG